MLGYCTGCSVELLCLLSCNISRGVGLPNLPIIVEMWLMLHILPLVKRVAGRIFAHIINVKFCNITGTMRSTVSSLICVEYLYKILARSTAHKHYIHNVAQCQEVVKSCTRYSCGVCRALEK